MEDYKGEIILFNVMKEKINEKEHFVTNAKRIMISDFKWFDIVTVISFVFLYTCLFGVLSW